MSHTGNLHEFVVHALPVDRCEHCGTEWFTIVTDVALQNALRGHLLRDNSAEATSDGTSVNDNAHFRRGFCLIPLDFCQPESDNFLNTPAPLKSLTRHRASWAGFFMDGRNRLWSLGSSYKRLYYSSVGELICFRMS